MTTGVEGLIRGVLLGERRAVAKSITLLESTHEADTNDKETLLTALPTSSSSVRLGISGSPGAGKSTLIEALGLHLAQLGHKVAVLAVDPSSRISGGAILGDKTRMAELSVHPRAFVRPSPAGSTLGGVAAKTREAMLVFEAAGYDVIIVETVGVGQNETAVRDMTDLFIVLHLPTAGDELQAMKKGVMELADVVLVNKEDLNPEAARLAQAQIESAMKLFAPHPAAPRVLTVSALSQVKVEAAWALLGAHLRLAQEAGHFEKRRKSQRLVWMWDLIRAELEATFRKNPQVSAQLTQLSQDVADGSLPATHAARLLLERLSPELQ